MLLLNGIIVPVIFHLDWFSVVLNFLRVDSNNPYLSILYLTYSESHYHEIQRCETMILNVELTQALDDIL